MAYIWSMVSVPGQPPGQRLIQTDVTKPQIVTFRVYNGHHDLESIYRNTIGSPEPLVTSSINRWYMGKGVSRIHVKHGKVRGALFIPPGRYRLGSN